MVKKQKTRRLSRAERVATIIEAARTVFEKKGYEAAKVADMAARIGVVEGTIYAYFDSKRELLEHLIAEWYREQIQSQREGLEGISDIKARMQFVIWKHLKTLTENAAFCALVLRESRNENGVVAETIRKLNREYTQPIVDAVNDGIEAGVFRSETSAALIRSMVYGTCEHLLWSYMAGRREIHLKLAAEQLTQSICEGIDRPSQNKDQSMELEKRILSALESIENFRSSRKNS